MPASPSWKNLLQLNYTANMLSQFLIIKHINLNSARDRLDRKLAYVICYINVLSLETRFSKSSEFFKQFGTDQGSITVRPSRVIINI